MFPKIISPPSQIFCICTFHQKFSAPSCLSRSASFYAKTIPRVHIKHFALGLTPPNHLSRKIQLRKSLSIHLPWHCKYPLLLPKRVMRMTPSLRDTLTSGKFFSILKLRMMTRSRRFRAS